VTGHRLVLAAAALLLLLSACADAQQAEEAPAASPEPTVEATETAAPTAEPTATAEPEPEPTEEPVPQHPTEPPDLADDPAGLAEQLTEAERAIRDERVQGQELIDAGHVQQAVYRRLVEQPDWQDEVIAAVPEEHAGAVRTNLEAGTVLRSMTTPQEQLPDWRIVEPAPAEELRTYYEEAEAEFGMPWQYLAAIHLVETRMGRIRGTSIAGAQGPMQFMPGTWDAYGEGDVNDNRDAIMAAGRYLRASGAPDDMDRALFAYNRHQYYVDAVSSYAQVMIEDPAAYRGYHGWQVYYITPGGDRLLPVGYGDS
jgi:hypothetical protein